MSQEVFMCFHCSCWKITSKTSFQTHLSKNDIKGGESITFMAHTYMKWGPHDKSNGCGSNVGASEYSKVFALLTTTFRKAGIRTQTSKRQCSYIDKKHVGAVDDGGAYRLHAVFLY